MLRWASRWFNRCMPLPDDRGSSSPNDYLASLGLTPSQRLIIERSAAEFEATGQWIDFDALKTDMRARPEAYTAWFRQYVDKRGDTIAEWLANS